MQAGRDDIDADTGHLVHAGRCPRKVLPSGHQARRECSHGSRPNSVTVNGSDRGT